MHHNLDPEKYIPVHVQQQVYLPFSSLMQVPIIRSTLLSEKKSPFKCADVKLETLKNLEVVMKNLVIYRPSWPGEGTVTVLDHPCMGALQSEPFEQQFFFKFQNIGQQHCSRHNSRPQCTSFNWARVLASAPLHTQDTGLGALV